MKIIMLENAVASEDGVNIKKYEAGETYDILGAIGYSFIKRGLAKAVEESQVESEEVKTMDKEIIPEELNVDGDDMKSEEQPKAENTNKQSKKAHKGAPENKGAK